MTGYTVNTGSTTKFSESWDRIFGASAKKATKKSIAPTVAAAKPAKAAAKGPKPTQVSVAKKAGAKAPAKAVATPSEPKTSVGKTVNSKQAAQTALTSGKR